MAVQCSIPALSGNIHFYKRAKSFFEEKQIIARNALPFIKNKTTMAADSSSTAMELLKLLKERNDLTLLTNSAEAFHELKRSKEINVIPPTGGELNKEYAVASRRKNHQGDYQPLSC